MAISESSVDEIIEFVLRRFWEHRREHAVQPPPFVLGLTGLQGSGKSTWAEALSNTLRQKHHLKVVVVSLDDFYHDHNTLTRIRNEHIDNPLLRTRGQPGTHDARLALEFFATLGTADDVRVPAFDKSKFAGEGDRMPQTDWASVPQTPPIDVVIFEGWCVGFQSLDTEALRKKWETVKQSPRTELTPAHCPFPTETLGEFELQHLLDINSNLQRYNETFMGTQSLDFLIHLDTEDLKNVYQWRIDQEHALRRAKGEGMTDDAVVSFVRGYMPAYELYLDRLRRESFVMKNESQLRVVLNAQRAVTGIKLVGDR